MRFVIWGLALAVFGAGALRKDIGALAVPGGRTVKALTAGKAHALVAAKESCAEVGKEMARVRTFGLAGTVVACGGAAAGEGWTMGTAVIVDEKGVVRWERAIGKAADLGEMVEWEQGRATFAAECGHCHGEDGAGTFHEGVKSMAGISLRKSDALILEHGEQFGAVPISTWGERQKAALSLFIRGL